MPRHTRKRGKGEGSISRRRDGRWHGRIDLGYVDGKRQRKYVYGQTQSEVIRKLDQTRFSLQQGLPLPPELQTIGRYLDEWIASTESSVRPKTFIRHKGIVDNHLKPSLGRIKLTKLTPQHIEGLMKAKTAVGLSNRSVIYIYRILHMAMKQAERRGLVVRNIARLVSPPRLETKPVEPWTPEEAKPFLRAIKEERLGALYEVAIGTGFRQGELLGIPWSNVALDVERPTITVTQTLQRFGSELRLVETKTKSSNRTLRIPSFVVDALKRQRQRTAGERLKLGPAWHQSDLVFCKEDGTPLTDHYVLRRFYKVLEQHGIRRITFQTLRHCYASYLGAVGADDKLMQTYLGHSTITITKDIYTHLMPGAAEQLMGKLDDLLAG